MKSVLFLFEAFFWFQFVSAQENQKDSNEKIYNTATLDVKPEFPGGIEEFYKYIGKNYNTPKVQGLAGKVYMTFVIDKDGSVVDIKIIRDLGYGTGEEAIRVLSNCPNWIPGELQGRKVRVLYALPITITSQYSFKTN